MNKIKDALELKEEMIKKAQDTKIWKNIIKCIDKASSDFDSKCTVFLTDVDTNLCKTIFHILWLHNYEITYNNCTSKLTINW